MKPKIDYKEIEKLIDLLEERNLSEFEMEVEGFKIKISRGAKGVASAPIPINNIITPSADSIKVEDAEGAEAEEEGLHIIKSPMVGTFYRSPDPSSPAFVEKGETVHPNQTICIVEAMKLMNEIEADIDGVIQEIFVENGKPVEYGQKLFAIKPL